MLATMYMDQMQKHAQMIATAVFTRQQEAITAIGLALAARNIDSTDVALRALLVRQEEILSQMLTATTTFPALEYGARLLQAHAQALDAFSKQIALAGATQSREAPE